jgi:hypothetical protein
MTSCGTIKPIVPIKHRRKPLTRKAIIIHMRPEGQWKDEGDNIAVMLIKETLAVIKISFPAIRFKIYVYKGIKQ